MDYDRYQDSFSSEGLRLAQAAAKDMDAPVPSCPGWTVGDVVRHTGTMYLTAAAGLRGGPSSSALVGETLDTSRDLDPKQDVLGWYGDAMRELHDQLERQLGEGNDPSVPVMTTEAHAAESEDDTAFWLRRMAHEAAVHRTDVEMAVGRPEPLEADLAVDGIGEALEVLLPLGYDGSARDAAAGRTVGVRCHQHTWRLTLGGDGVDVYHQPGFADAGVDGEPTEVLLYLWGRRPSTVVSRTGDGTVLAAFRRRLAACMV